MTKHNPYEAVDRAVLLDLMARAYCAALGEPWPPDSEMRRASVLEWVRALHAGRIAPETAADRAAVAVLAPDGSADLGEPITAADLDAMATCPTCGGEQQVPRTVESVDRPWETTIDCPDCGGTGKRNDARRGA